MLVSGEALGVRRLDAAYVGHLVLTAVLGGLGFFFSALIIRKWRLQTQDQPAL